MTHNISRLFLICDRIRINYHAGSKILLQKAVHSSSAGSFIRLFAAGNDNNLARECQHTQ